MSLTRPFPVANFFLIDALGVSVVDALDDLALQPFFDVSADGAQTRNAVDDINGQVEAVDLVDDRKLQRGIDIALSPYIRARECCHDWCGDS